MHDQRIEDDQAEDRTSEEARDNALLNRMFLDSPSYPWSMEEIARELQGALRPKTLSADSLKPDWRTASMGSSGHRVLRAGPTRSALAPSDSGASLGTERHAPARAWRSRP
jgi:hypothetical protein